MKNKKVRKQLKPTQNPQNLKLLKVRRQNRKILIRIGLGENLGDQTAIPSQTSFKTEVILNL